MFTKEELMEIVAKRVENCTACPLYLTRTNVVVGEGNLDTRIVFVGEGPGEEEDKTGRPFVGRAGMLLTELLQETGFRREDVYICNVVKCRPPNNRTPTSEERLACKHFLLAQLEIINPDVIVALGATALSFFIEGKNVSITKVRGTPIDWLGGIKVVPTFHPSYLLRNRSKELRKTVLEDFKKAKSFIKEV
ncbi:type-4 uracil-DNA glycosylase [Thermotoga sp. KOL6]|uniref:type-4 uracil-DNA glycosylase n=1 Tax=Thermotoga sp. KOL6 TaxID=126741 RepID=UPI000C76256C|nr:type-4 uracil-DNA glycosylase [Thermotoga sp. KOL6]PLV59230.1 uracil-DNA glycosylase [Thermotoga sp. KOL6]